MKISTEAREHYWLTVLKLNVMRLRLEKDLTQGQLAEMAGVSTGYICNIEHARSNVTLSVIVRLADALGSDPLSILTDV